MEGLPEVKIKMAWFEKEWENLTEQQRNEVERELKNISDTLGRIMLRCFAVNKR